tara:strand:+ start:9808 stop:10260 length:453 start_codon:yes stop_codon:yes gene_type:complete
MGRVFLNRTMKKIYIAGKVTGEPIAECTMKFGSAQVQIRDLGFIAVNPLEVVNDFKTPWRPAMQKCITALMDCDAIFFCHDWKDSPGAQLEAKIAEGFQMPFFHSIQELRKFPITAEKEKTVECEHRNQTQHWSDVFGHYKSCLDCGRDL